MKETVITEKTAVDALDGVGKRRAELLAKLGIVTLGDLISYYPRAYEKRGDIRLLGTAPTDTPAAFLLTVATEVSVTMIRRGLTIAKFRAFDESGSVSVVFFNAPYIKDIFHTGSHFRFYGTLTYQKKTAQLVNPKYEPYIESVPLPDFIPVYSLTAGISSKILASLVRSAFDKLLPTFRDPLPEDIRLAHGLPTLTYAVENAHFPTTEDALSRAIRRLAFDEMFFFALGISRAAGERTSRVGITFPPCRVEPFLALLPYELTASQKAAVNDIYRDMTRKNSAGVTPPMSRILVGDVGSGKTVCAALAIYFALKAGYQAALMAPTEILARQHAADLAPLFEKLGFRTELLLGSTTAKEKRRIYDAAAEGSSHLLIGTHALLSDKLIFSSLGLVVTDEQHRFGV
ncbi:MAG TPA: ATP-dependent DNA helicase RecG, partial [Clostridiales bacterium]|nr:ATP-dependent DNA helicase RecG [Clostridiales bacterium]